MPIKQTRLMDLINIADSMRERLKVAKRALDGDGTDQNPGFELAASNAYYDRDIDKLWEQTEGLIQQFKIAYTIPEVEIEILAREKTHFNIRKKANVKAMELMERRRALLNREVNPSFPDDSNYAHHDQPRGAIGERQTIVDNLDLNIKHKLTQPEVWRLITTNQTDRAALFTTGDVIDWLPKDSDLADLDPILDNLIEKSMLYPGDFHGEFRLTKKDN